MSHFGPLVIGREQHEREQAVEQSGAHLFGPSVLDSGFEQKRVEGSVLVAPPDGTSDKPFPDGPQPKLDRPPMVPDPIDQPVATTEDEPADDPEEQQPAPSTVPKDLQPFMVSVSALREHLSENPMLVDRFMQAELHRPDGIRKTAAAAMLDAESKRPPMEPGGIGPRPEVIEVLEEWVAKAG
jgi:hypothetical protein